jgi:hypothetical protein
MNWLSYTSLAWTERILSPPEDMREEAQVYIDAVKMNFDGGARTMLHLGCGAGGMTFISGIILRSQGWTFAKRCLLWREGLTLRSGIFRATCAV